MQEKIRSKTEYFNALISWIKEEKPSKEKISKKKVELCRKYSMKKIPTDIEIFLNADEKDIKILKKFLQTKPTRTMSGVSVIAVMSAPFPCPHGACRMCPTYVQQGIPMSYTGKEPSTRRAIRNDYDPYLIIMNRLEQYVVTGHSFDKIELIIQGGTFPSFLKDYIENYMIDCYKAMNDFSDKFFDDEFDFLKFKEFFELPGNIEDNNRLESIKKKLLELKSQNREDLEYEKKRNEDSNVRCVGLTIETRPDWGKKDIGNEMLRWGTTRVELGVQSVYDDVLENIERGHTVQDNKESIKDLKDLGFKLNFHYMPGLPGIKDRDLAGLKELFESPDYRPDMIKLYPCMVLKGSKLYEDWVQGKFKPITTEESIELITEFKRYVPEYCRIMRVQRDIPTYVTEDGVDRTNLRQYIEKRLEEKGIKCRCIRCREAGRLKEAIKDFKIKVIEYDSSGGKEFFIAAESNDALIGFCRLRFPSQFLREEITKRSALIRELHVYGEAITIGKEGNMQHRGFGRMLLEKAEEIVKENGKEKIVIISGVGVRTYYRKFGYELEGPYMVKLINKNNSK